jgi:hypothetical protein
MEPENEYQYRGGQVQRAAMMWLSGACLEQIAADESLDFDTVRARLGEAQQGWRKSVTDIEATRAELVATCRRVREFALQRLASEKARGLDRVAWGKLALSAVNTEQEVLGLRRLRVDVGSSQLAGLLAAMAGGSGGLAVLGAGAREAIAAEWRAVDADGTADEIDSELDKQP